MFPVALELEAIASFHRVQFAQLFSLVVVYLPCSLVKEHLFVGTMMLIVDGNQSLRTS